MKIEWDWEYRDSKGKYPLPSSMNLIKMCSPKEYQDLMCIVEGEMCTWELVENILIKKLKFIIVHMEHVINLTNIGGDTVL